MEFGIPYSLTKIPKTEGVISFSINNHTNLLACLTEKSIQLFDNSYYYPIFITSLTQFFESFNIKGPNNWICWITDEDLAYVTENGNVFISHVVIIERKQAIHDYDDDFYKKYLNKYELIKILAPISISIFDQSSYQSESPTCVTSVFSAYNHVCVCTSESQIISVNKNAVISHIMKPFSKPTRITNAGYYPPSSLLCLVDSNIKIINFDIPTFENKVEPIIEEIPVKHASIIALNSQHTFLAVFKPGKGSLRIFQIGLPEWKPPITVYASKTNIDQEPSKESKNRKQNVINSVDDPVINLFWNSRGTSLSIIHKSGKTCVFFIETKTLLQTQIDYFSQKPQQQSEEHQQQPQQPNDEITNQGKELDSNEMTAETFSNTNNLVEEMHYCFLFDNYGERLFVSNGESVVIISILQNNDFFLFTSGTIFDLRRNINLYSALSLYPIKNVRLDVRRSILLVSTSKGVQLIDSNNGKIVSNFMPLVSEHNPKNRCVLDAHFLGDNQICAIVGPSEKFCDDKFELNFIPDRSESIEYDLDNSFYSQFDNCYLYDEVNKEIEKQLDEEFQCKKIDVGPIRSLIIILSFDLKADKKDDDENMYEIKPDLLIKSYFIPSYYDYIENRGLLADEGNIAYITTMKKLDEPTRFNKYYLAKSNNVLAIQINKLSNQYQIIGIAMSTVKSARILLSNGSIFDEKLEPFGNDLFLTSNRQPIFFDNLLTTKNPPVVYYIYNTRKIEGSVYKYAFYSAMPIFSCLDYFMRYLEIPFAFDGMLFYVLPDRIKFGSFNFKFVNIGQHILIDAIRDYKQTIYLLNFVYRKFNQLPVVICETFKEALSQDFLSYFILYIIPHLKLEEVAQIIQYLPTRSDKQTFSEIFDALFKYISHSNKYFTDSNKKYMVVTVNYESFSSKIIKLDWNQIFSLIDKNIRYQIFLNISTSIFPKLINEMSLDTNDNPENEEKVEPTESSLILNEELIRFLLENGEIIRAYLVSSKSNKEVSNHFCEIFKNVIQSKSEHNGSFSDSLKMIEKEKNKWSDNEQLYPLVFHLLGCLFQVDDLSLFSAATFIIIGQVQKFNAVIISDENAKKSIESYMNENPDGSYVKEISEALEAI